ncbi:hypothetical protein [Massilia sp. PWRC2]|uniref:hypothetical protein n=1 Tax=Massilia sp. PWRC2 TaxID=2804626 RepID=UPI003CEE3ECD
MPLLDTLAAGLAHLSRICGFDTIDGFPPGHPYASTRWNRAYFDIASDTKAEKIERILADAITNTPLVFAHISHPTPAMQRALIAVIEAVMRRGDPTALVTLLIAAYDAPHTIEAVPGLRRAIEDSRAGNPSMRAFAVLEFLGQMQAPFGVIDMIDQQRLPAP